MFTKIFITRTSYKNQFGTNVTIDTVDVVCILKEESRKLSLRLDSTT